jgi:hypothetical protein
VARQHVKAKSTVLIGVRRNARTMVRWGGPGRVGPAFAGLFVEPLTLDFWKLEKSFVLTPSSSPFPCPRAVKRLSNQVRGLSRQPFLPHHRHALLTVIAFLVIPASTPSASLSEDARRLCSTLCLCQVHGGLLVVAVVHTARKRHSRSDSPELSGRIVFFITAVGRSPPTCKERIA